MVFFLVNQEATLAEQEVAHSRKKQLIQETW